MILNNRQLEKLSELLMDLAKAFLIGGLVAPSVSSLFDFISVGRMVVLGLACAIVSVVALSKEY